MREEIARGVVPTNELLDKHLDEYKQAVDRRLHVESIRPAQRRESRPKPDSNA